MRLGLYGGRFDPVHTGHLLVAERAREALRLDAVLFIPSRDPPHKEASAPAAARRDMVLLATADHPHFRLSEVELGRPGPSYTVDTVLELRGQHPGAELFYLLGADAYADIATWHRPRELVDLAQMVVLPRPGASLEGLEPFFRARARLLAAPLWEVSSTEVRRRLGAGESVRYLVPPAVEAYLRKTGLYLLLDSGGARPAPRPEETA